MPGFDEMTFLVLVLLVATMLFSGLAHGALGLGFPLMATPLLSLLTDVRSAILITLLPTISVNIISLLKGGRWRDSIGRFWPMVIYVAAGSWLGTNLLVISDPKPFKLLLALIVLLYLNLDRLPGVHLNWIRTYPSVAMVVFGLPAGLLAGTVNVMVPLLIIMFLELRVPPTATVQTFNMCFLTGKVTQTVVFARAGHLNGDMLISTAPLAAVAVAALIAGMLLRSRIAAETYRGWLRMLLWVLAFVLLAQFFSSVCRISA